MTKIFLAIFNIYLLLTILIVSCNQTVELSPKPSRYIASEHSLKIDGKEALSSGVKEFLLAEQNLSWSPDSSSQFYSTYLPGNNPKFPLPYFLVPEDEANLHFAESLDSRIVDQLVMRISGKKHYKLFIHPETEAYYDFLKSAYNYIGSEQTEFFATPTSSFEALIVWNKNSGERKPFIVKISLLKNIVGVSENLITENEIERAIAIQKVIGLLGEKKLDSMNVKMFPETFGFTVDRILTGASGKVGGELIFEIPDYIVGGEKKWFSLSSLMSTNKKTTPLIIDIIKKSGLSSFVFFKTYMIDGYLDMLTEMSLKNGINFKPDLKNLFFETTNDLKPLGKWVLRDFSHLSPDIISMAKSNGPVEVYLESESADKYKLRSGRSDSIMNYVLYYKPKIFDPILLEVAKHDSSLTAEQIQTLKNTIDSKYTRMINTYLNLNLKNVPNPSDYKTIEEMVLSQTEFNEKISKKEIKNSENLQTFIFNKKEKKEWVELSSKKGRQEFYLTDHGLYEIVNKKVVSFALFNRDELDEYNSNNKMLTNFTMLPVEPPESTSCFGISRSFFTVSK